MNLVHAIYASAVFVIAYALITTERFNKTMVALAGAVAVFFLPVVNSHEVFYSEDTGIDWDVIFLLLGMMIIISVVRQTGVFEYIAIWSAKRATGSPLRIMILLVLVTAVGSAFLENVTTVLLIAPVTLLVCDRLAVSAVPFLVVEAFAANGMAHLHDDVRTHAQVMDKARCGVKVRPVLHRLLRPAGGIRARTARTLLAGCRSTP